MACALSWKVVCWFLGPVALQWFFGLGNLGSESETCVGSRVRLVGISISFEKNFYRLPFTPPLSGSPFRSFKWYQSRFESLLTLTSLRSKDGIPGTGFRSSTLRWQELPDVDEDHVWFEDRWMVASLCDE
jgi:hypothetical protein